jgi:hypothetical protein
MLTFFRPSRSGSFLQRFRGHETPTKLRTFHEADRRQRNECKSYQERAQQQSKCQATPKGLWYPRQPNIAISLR